MQLEPRVAEEVHKTEAGPTIVEVDEKECSSCVCKPASLLFCYGKRNSLSNSRALWAAPGGAA